MLANELSVWLRESLASVRLVLNLPGAIAIMFFRSIKPFSIALMSTLLVACGGGSTTPEAQTPVEPSDDGRCGAREYYNGSANLPAVYFNGFLPVSAQVPQGTETLDTAYTYNAQARQITVTETNSLNAGITTRIYQLDALGRPVSRSQRVVNTAIQLDRRLPELLYTYDDRGLLSGYTSHAVDGNRVAEEPNSSLSFQWSEVGGISQAVNNAPFTSDLISATTTYTYACTRLASVTIVSVFRSQAETTRRYEVTTTGSGKALTSTTTLVGSAVPGRSLTFDNSGNLIAAGLKTINYEATTEPVVNIELFENAIRHSGLL